MPVLTFLVICLFLSVSLEPDDTIIPGITSHPTVVYGVYKPKPKVSIFSLQSMKDGIVSNHRKEVAAYRIDRLLQLNHVPLTKSILHEEHEGSVQLFIPDVVSGRDMNELDIHKPKQSGKFSASRGARSLPSPQHPAVRLPHRQSRSQSR